MNEYPTIQELVEPYLAHRRSLGYKLQGAESSLRSFATFAARRGQSSPLTTDLALEWATKSKDAAPEYQCHRLSAVRCFARYCAAFDARTEIPPSGLLGPSHERTTPYIYSAQEILALLAAARSLQPPHALRPHTYVVLLGLLASTGIRIGEALRLCITDVRWEESALIIRNSKRISERVVPLHASTVEALRGYADRRPAYLEDPAFPLFFISDKGGPMKHVTVSGVFRLLRAQAGIRVVGCRQPRIHDLRHTFACTRMMQWHKEGIPVDQALPALSAYLGHVQPTDTYWYLSGIPELLAAYGERFEQYAQRLLRGENP